MSNLAEYFAKNRYQGRWQIGDRVFGRWNKIPFIGSVGTDSVVSESAGPRVTVCLDLPILYQGQVHNILVVKPKDIKKLVDY
jgi:hypothetical protein